jgi:hypothetical protein
MLHSGKSVLQNILQHQPGILQHTLSANYQSVNEKKRFAQTAQLSGQFARHFFCSAPDRLDKKTRLLVCTYVAGVPARKFKAPH